MPSALLAMTKKEGALLAMAGSGRASALLAMTKRKRTLLVMRNKALTGRRGMRALLAMIGGVCNDERSLVMIEKGDLTTFQNNKTKKK